MSQRLSFVLTVHRGQAYLTDAVRSILDDPSPAVEVVAVDNASPDHAPELLDELARADDRLVVLHLPEVVPVGVALQAGLEAATGDYVWFVEPTDRLAPDALRRVLTRLDDVDVDVLLVDHVITGSTGQPRPPAYADLVAKLGAKKPVTVDKQPLLLDSAADLYAKVLRRAFLDHWQLRFAPTGAARVGFGWQSLLAADRVTGLAGGPAYTHHEPRNAVRVPAVDGAEADVIEEYARVYEFLDTHADTIGARRRLVTGRLARDGGRVWHRVPPASRPKVFRRLAEVVGAQVRDDDVLPPGRQLAARVRLLKAGRYRSFTLLERAVSKRRELADGPRRGVRLRRRTVRRLRRRGLRSYYRVQRRFLPLDPNLALYAAYWYRGYSCNPRAIYEAARRLAPQIHGVWVTEADAASSFPPDVPTVVAGSREYFRALARATYFVNNVNFPNHWVKRPGTFMVQTHHGTPLKRMGLDLRNAAVAGQRMEFGALLRRCSTWDFSVSSNRLSTLTWERVYPTRYTTLEYGYPRNDVLANATDADSAAARAALGIEADRKVLLYAPTHREYSATEQTLLDIARLSDSLGEGWVVLNRSHYYYADTARGGAVTGGRVVDVTNHPSVEQLSLASDLLVTDYSSVMFDYAVLGRPIVIYAPDWEIYQALRGTTFDLTEEPPGVVVRTQEDLVETLVSGVYAADAAEKALAGFRAKFSAWDDGRASERVVRRVLLGQDDVELPPGARR